MTDKVTFTGNQAKALTALMTENSVRDAATTCGLTKRTLFRYLADDKFIQALRTRQAEQINEATRRLTDGLQKAIEALEDLIKGGDPTNKRLAATAWLSHALRLTEFSDLESRIAALEGRTK